MEDEIAFHPSSFILSFRWHALWCTIALHPKRVLHERRTVRMLARPAADRLLLGSPLRRPRIALVIVGVLALLTAIALVGILLLVAGFALLRGALQVFGLALLISSLLSIVPIVILCYLDRRERESRWVFATAFLWGGLIATGLALPANEGIMLAIDAWIKTQPTVREFLGGEATLLLAAPIAGPIVEETTKGFGLVLLFLLLRAEFDNLRDGLIYGALVGVGFNWMEAAIYVVNGYAQYGVAPWGQQLGTRYALFGLAGHALFTGLFGASLGLARQTGRRWLKIAAPIGGYLLALLTHMFNNILPLLAIILLRLADEPLPDTSASAPPDPVPFLEAWLTGSLFYLVLFLPALLLLGLAVWRSGIWERRVIREQLATETAPVVLDAERKQIDDDRMFATRRVEVADRRRGRVLVNAQNELAFRKWRVERDGGDAEQDVLVRGWREEIARLRGDAYTSANQGFVTEGTK